MRIESDHITLHVDSESINHLHIREDSVSAKSQEEERKRIHVNDNDTTTVNMETQFIQRVGADQYTGSYEFTPSENTQTIQINGKTPSRNITINAIPENYGRLIWDGHTLTVY